jgi:hypothetical protein
VERTVVHSVVGLIMDAGRGGDGGWSMVSDDAIMLGHMCKEGPQSSHEKAEN